MSMHQVIVSAALAGLVVGHPPLGTVAAQSAAATSQSVWENERMRVDWVSLAPGDRLSRESTDGSVIVFMTTDLDGRMPPAEAAWQDPGQVTMENRGRTRFEALVVDLKGRATRSGGATPPEVVRGFGSVAPSAIAGSYAAMMQAQNLIMNDRISVTKESYAAAWSAEPLHFHPQDVVVVYLRSGYIWPTSSVYGPEHVRRGDVRIVPGNVLHTTFNAGSDPLEFLLIIPS
jgi:hypothetical protein